MTVIASMKEFAITCHKILKSDRDVNIACAGFTGEGKSCFITHLLTEYSKISCMPFSFKSNLTWNREELLTWIDGDKKSKSNDKGLKKGQMPEYSPIGVDELFTLFFKRNWYDNGQIEAISTLNMCRDRHLLIAGGIPNFWDLDGAFCNRIRFYIYIPTRGKAWIFEQENNPFASDPWNKSQNKSNFRRYKVPYKMPNFICEIKYNNWSFEEKKAYYLVRNTKRLHANDKQVKEKIEKYKDIKEQRDKLIRILINQNHDLYNNHKEFCDKNNITKLKLKDISNNLGLSIEAIRLINMGKL
jgi:hypothetical protein